MKQKISSILPPLLLCLLSLLIYFRTASPYITFGDSPEYIITAFVKGVAHPPSYPLYTILSILVSLFPFGTLAFKINFLSGILHSLTLLTIYLIIKKITKEKAAAFIASLLLAFSPLFWTYSLVAEVFPLNNLLFSLLIFQALLIIEKPQKLLYFSLFGLTLGLSLTNHYTILLSFPAFILYFLQSRETIKISKQKMTLLIFSFIIGLLPILYLPLAASQNPPYNLGNPSNLSNLIKVLTREMYDFAKETGIGPYKIHPTNLFPNYLNYILKNFHLFLFFIVPAFYFLKNNKRLGLFLSSLFLLTGPLFLILYKIEIPNNTVYAIVERFYLMSFLLLPIFIGLGIAQVLKKIINYSFRITFIATIITLSLIPLVNQYKQLDQSKNDLFPKFGHFLVDSLPSNSILVYISEYAYSVVLNFQLVENYRTDLITIVPSFLQYDWYINQLKSQYKNKDELFESLRKSTNFKIFADTLCTTLAPKYNVFLETQSDQYNPKTLQCPIVKHGLVWQVLPPTAKVDTLEIMRNNDELFASFKLDSLNSQNYPQDLHTQMLLFQLSGIIYNYNLNFQKELVNRPEKKEEIDRLAAKLSDHGPSLNSLANILLPKGQSEEAKILLERSIKNMPSFAPSYFNLAGIYKTVYKDNAKATRFYRKYLDLSPNASSQEKDMIESLIKSR